MREEVRHRGVDGRPADGRHPAFCSPVRPSTTEGGLAVTKAEQIAERVDALVAKGSTKAAAYEEVAKELGLKPNSVRGAYYQANRKRNGGKSRSRVRETTVEGATEQAIASLEKALADIDLEIEAAKARADEAKREFDALKASATERKSAIKAKIEALS